ncbi:MAG: DEAD/DEAH box helicase family protein, partial [Candidatus Omnitrophica bacterium]|nr:DEAD/DEAH box helicase family protein [Candidatus Omnitrophota bacterium]
MKIILDNVYAFYEEKNDEIEDFLRIKHPQRMYIEAYKNGTWDGYVRFVKKTPKGFYYFPSGFIFAFSDFFSKFEIVDKRKKKEVILKDYNLQGIQLRDYQIFSIEEALRKERGILNLATNSGKTEVSIAISKALSNLRVLYILHRQHLLFQTVKRFKDRIDEKIGYIGAGKKEGLDNRIVIASIQTFYSLI